MTDTDVAADDEALRTRAIDWLRSMRCGDTWRFRFSERNPPTLIATACAAMLGKFLGYVDELSDADRSQWAAEILACQQADSGWFDDDDIQDGNRTVTMGKDGAMVEYCRERALLHRTRYALCALDALGAAPAHALSIVATTWQGTARMRAWLESLDLSDYWYSSNMMMDAYLMLDVERRRADPGSAAHAELLESIAALLDFCDAHTSTETGYHDAGRSELRNAMAGAMHLYPVYFLCGAAPLHPEAVVRTTLSLQQPDGTFAYENDVGGEDCLDYDAALVLANFFCVDACAGLRDTIVAALDRTAAAVRGQVNADGGFPSHRRATQYQFGSKSTTVEVEGSNLWATYSRMMTLAFAAHSAGRPTRLVTSNNLMEIWDAGTGKSARFPARCPLPPRAAAAATLLGGGGAGDGS